MSEETMKILQMLEDDLITSEQAERLIEAVSNSGKNNLRHKIPHVSKKVFKEIEKSVEGLAEKMQNMKPEITFGGFAERDEVFENIRAIRIKQLDGDVSVRLSDDESAHISGERMKSLVTRDGKKVSIDNMAGDVDATIPAGLRLDIDCLNGDVEIESFTGDLKTRVYDGDLDATLLNSNFTSEILSGDAKIALAGNCNGKMRLLGGDISIKLDKDIDIKLNIDLQEGEIINNTDTPSDSASGGKAVITFGEGSNKLNISNLSGHIKIEMDDVIDLFDSDPSHDESKA